jgi:hypothetical protein
MNRIHVYHSATAQNSRIPCTPWAQPRNETAAIISSHRRLRMHAICCFLSLLLLPVAALADGKMISSTAFPANITIPDQQALIHYTDGTERLVIETRFTGAGTNFAWVVPLPSQPVVEAATTGLFPTLRYLFQPRVIHNVPHYYIGILVVIGLALLLRAAFRAGVLAGTVSFLAIVLLGATLLLPALGTAKAKGMATTTEGAVSILDRRVVGVFDTTTIASQDPKALQNWLRENGFVVSAETDTVIASYVTEGWVFVAAKIRRDLAELQTSTPHPLSFTFKTPRPVYPMRLTGINNGPLRVELYIFGPKCASAPHFKVERCTRPDYPPPSEKWSRNPPEALHIVHPLLRQYVGGSPVATKLTATLTPADMQRDVWLDWGVFWEKESRLYSPQGARTYAFNWGAAVFAAGLLFAWLASVSSEPNRRRLLTLGSGATVLGLVLASVLHLALPKTEVRLVKMPGARTHSNLYSVSYELETETNLTPATARAVLAEVSKSLDVRYKRSDSGDDYMANFLLGGRVREEDSPGNYTFRQTASGLELVSYDAQGTEHLLSQLPRPAK